MAIAIDWASKVISVPQADLTFIAGTTYEHDIDVFRLAIAALADDAEGMPFDTAFQHNTEVTISGVTYARQVIIINGYSVTYEDTASSYTVRTIGANTNVLDVDAGILNTTPLVAYVSTNSAGLIVTADSGLTGAEAAQLQDMWTRLFGGRLYVDPDLGREVLRTALGVLYSQAEAFSDDGVTPYDATTGVARRDEHVKP